MLKINISRTFLPGCVCKACYHSEMSKQVTLRENGPFSYRTPLLAWGPPAFCRHHTQAGAGGSVGAISHQVLSLSAYLGNEATAKVITHYTWFIWEALLHTAFNKMALTMHSSLMSTHAGREALRGLSVQGSHREQRGKGRLFRRNINVYFY